MHSLSWHLCFWSSHCVCWGQQRAGATCLTRCWAEAPVAVWGDDAVSLARQQAGSDGVWAETLWTPGSTSLTRSGKYTETHLMSNRDVPDQNQRNHAGRSLRDSHCARLQLWIIFVRLWLCVCACTLGHSIVRTGNFFWQYLCCDTSSMLYPFAFACCLWKSSKIGSFSQEYTSKDSKFYFNNVHAFTANFCSLTLVLPSWSQLLLLVREGATLSIDVKVCPKAAWWAAL